MTVSPTKHAPFTAEAFVRHARDLLHEEASGRTTSSPELAGRGDHDLNPDALSWIEPGQTFRDAAVLVPLVDRGDELQVLFTQRTHTLPTHAGQISFPGGKIDEGDKTPLAAALRETHEETGIAPEFVDVVGYLDGYLTGTGYCITPVVAVVRNGFALVPEPGEVAEIFEVPLKFLMDPSNHQTDSRVWRGKRRFFYAMPYDGRYIWGATAGILRNLFERLYAPGP
jgi:8-oxo-dGTP pyrophosphatase MutT (NUDIX family)